MLGEHRAVPLTASSRIQRWALTLLAYNYSINHRPGNDHASADVLSCLPLSLVPQDVPEPGDTILLFECLQVAPLSQQLIRRVTDLDPILAKVRNFVLREWPSQLEGEEFPPYVRQQAELSMAVCFEEVELWFHHQPVPKFSTYYTALILVSFR